MVVRYRSDLRLREEVVLYPSPLCTLSIVAGSIIYR